MQFSWGQWCKEMPLGFGQEMPLGCGQAVMDADLQMTPLQQADLEQHGGWGNWRIQESLSYFIAVSLRKITGLSLGELVLAPGEKSPHLNHSLKSLKFTHLSQEPQLFSCFAFSSNFSRSHH